MKKLILFFLLALANITFAKTSLTIKQFIRDSYINLSSYKVVFISGKDTVANIQSAFSLNEKVLFKDSLNLYSENEITILYSKNDTNWKESKYNFHLYGDEKEVIIEAEYNRIILENIDIYRYYKAPKEIKIFSNWDELIGSEPAFKIINNSSFTFFSLFNEFWGSTYKLEKNEWVLESIGGICGTRSDGPPFKPGDTIISKVADYIGEDYAVQEKGKYKYVVLMSTGNALNFGRPVPQSYPDKKTYDIYSLEKDFEITSDSIHYPRSKYEKREIRGISNLMQKLVEKVILSEPATIKK
ncbi:MAG: hypothetical protein JST55_11560 [Bacteroidetes bacterium]|nr:hypothetical protein [Bacteroidota bacterium]